MKINKSLTLVILLTGLLALTVASQISQITSTISVEEKKDCTINYYNSTENVYGYVTRERDVRGNCLYYYNYTICLNTSGLNTACSVQQSIYNTSSCIIGKELYQNYEVIGSQIVLRNTTNCIPKSYIVSIAKGSTTEKKEIDFLDSVCIQSQENDCLAITCGTLKGGSARNGVFNGCDGGKSCQKFLFCEDKIEILYKASRSNFVREDPTFHLSKLAYREVGE